MGVDVDMPQRTRSGTRECRSRREKYRKHAEKTEAEIRKDPWSFDIAQLELPSSIFEGRPGLQNKFVMRVSGIVDMAKAELSQMSPSSSAAFSCRGDPSAFSC